MPQPPPPAADRADAQAPVAMPPSTPDPTPFEGHGLHGLAKLAFGSLTRADGTVFGQHLALLQAESLELDLSDPAQRQFGDYELLEFVGEGGMGAVYRARHLPLDREVAVKLLSAGPWASKDFIARFEREAQNAARMQHPNIVTVFEAGSHDGLHFIAMRLVEGQSLSALLKRDVRFTPRQAAALMRTVAEALAYAHSLAILHLDLKPGNVLVGTDGLPYVADFGLARRLDSALAADNDEVSGTPAYMAPEQARVRSQKLTAATDVWGLGAILYELLTGQPPFRAETAQATIQLVLEGHVRSPRRMQPTLPLDLQAVVLRCLARDPDERYPSARALADDLARFTEGRPVQARPLSAPQRMWRWARREPRLAATAVLAFGLLVAGLAATTQQWRRADASANVARENLWATRAQAAQEAFADGDGFRGLRSLVANVEEMERVHRDGDAAVERQRIGSVLANAPQLAGLLRLPPGESATSVAIAPDGRHFAVATTHDDWSPPHYVRQYDLQSLRETWATQTDQRTFLMAGGDGDAPHSGLRYTADGRHLLVSVIEQAVLPVPRWSDMIAFDARDGHVVWPEGLPQKQADIVYDNTIARALVRFRSDASLRWPDSAQFYEVAGWRPIGPRHAVATTLAADFWMPVLDGSAWLGTRDTARFALYQVPSLKPRWHLDLPQTSLVRAWNPSHDGRLIALGSVDGAVRIVDAASGTARTLDAGPAARVLRVEFSADDRTLAAADENGQLWIWDVATGISRSAPQPVVQGSPDAVLLRFAGDTLFAGGLFFRGGSQIAYVGMAPRALFHNAAVPGAARLHGLSPFGTAFDVSPGAARLVRGDGRLVDVWRLPPSPLLEVRAAPLPSTTLSFDGRRVVAVDGDNVRVVDAAGGQALSPSLQHPAPVQFAELSPDGDALVTVADRSVRVIDTASWQLRGAPIVLPQTPETAEFAASAPLLLLTTTYYDGDVQRTRVHRIDLARGTELEPGLRLDTLNDLELDAHGRFGFLIARNGVTHAYTGPVRIALADGKPGCAPPVKPQELWGFVLAADGRSAWLNTVTPAGPELQRWDLDACRKIAVAAPGVQPDAVLRARGGGLAVHRGGKQALILIDAQGKREAALGEAIPDAMHDFALSADGTRAAFATRNAVHLIDVHTGRRLSAPLTAPIAGDDVISALAFSPDGVRLLARTLNGRWLLWQLPRSGRDVGALARLARVLDPEPAQGMADADINALRKDLGTVVAGVSAAAPVPAAPVVFAPAEGAGRASRLVPLDLGPALNVPLAGKVWNEPNAAGDLTTLAPGPQRFLDVDYRVTGGVQLSGGDSALAIGPERRRSAVVAVPDVAAVRVHVLVLMHIPIDAGAPPRAFGKVVLIGTDGRETPLEIRTVRDVVTNGFNPQRAAASARVAWSGPYTARVRGGDAAQPASHVYAVALDVPSTTGPIRGLRFDVADGPMEAPLFYAATLERVRAGDAPETAGGVQPQQD